MKQILKLIFVALAWAGCFQPAAAAPLKVAAYEGFLPNYASSAGYFSQAGLDAQVIVSSVALNLVKQGRADACIAGMSVPVQQYLEGKDTVLLAQLYGSFGFYGVSRYSAASAAAIKTVSAGGVGEPYRRMRAMMKYLKVTGAEFDKKNISQADLYKLLENGKTDLILVNSRALMRKIRAEGKYYVIEPEDAYKGGSFNDGIFTTGATLAARGPDLDKFVAAMLDTMAGIAAEPQRFIDYLVKQEGFTQDEAVRVQADMARSAAEVAGEPAAADVARIETEVAVSTARVVNKKAGGMLRPGYALKAIEERKVRKAREDAAKKNARPSPKEGAR